MNELVGQLNNLIDSYVGDWKLECIYPFIYRGFNNGHTLCIFVTLLKDLSTEILLLYNVVNEGTTILDHLDISNKYTFGTIERILENNLIKKVK